MISSVVKFSKKLNITRNFCASGPKQYSINEVNANPELLQKWDLIQEHWTKEYYNNRKPKMEYFENNISDEKKRRISLLVEYISKASLNEQRYVAELIEDSFKIGLRNEEFEGNLPSFMERHEGTWPPENKNWFKQFGVFSGGQGSGETGASNQQSDAANQNAEAVEEESAPAEKTSFSLMLNSFDPSKKISIIKEVKNSLGYGLKEAKELVEKAPTTLKTPQDKEEGDKYMELFTKLGAVCELK